MITRKTHNASHFCFFPVTPTALKAKGSKLTTILNSTLKRRHDDTPSSCVARVQQNPLTGNSAETSVNETSVLSRPCKVVNFAHLNAKFQNRFNESNSEFVSLTPHEAPAAAIAPQSPSVAVGAAFHGASA